MTLYETLQHIMQSMTVVIVRRTIKINQAQSEYKHSLTFHIQRCYHSNETHALIANPPNSAELGGTPYHSPKLHLGPCSSVGMR